MITGNQTMTPGIGKMSAFRRGLLFISPYIQCRHRGKIHFKHPQTFFDRKVMDAITRPILPNQLVSEAVNCSVLKRLAEKPQDEVNLYEQFLVRECKKMFVDYRMIIAFQPLPMTAKQKLRIKNKLYTKQFYLKFFNNSVMRQAIGGTKWQNLMPLLNSNNIYIVHKDGNLHELVKQTKRVPELIMLGGIIDNTLLSRAGILCNVVFTDIGSARSQLYNTLTTGGAPQLCSSLVSHQRALSANLTQYVKDRTSSTKTLADDDDT